MSKILECGSVVPGCGFVMHGDSEEDLMMQAVEHARSAHDVKHMSEQLKARVRAAIKEDTAAKPQSGAARAAR